MRKLGIVFMMMGLLSFIVLAINGFTLRANQHDYADILGALWMFVVGGGLYSWGRYRKKKAQEKGDTYEEVSWGVLILGFVVISVVVSNCIFAFRREQDNSFEGQIRRANQDCPYVGAGGNNQIVSIEIEDKKVVYTVKYDEAIRLGSEISVEQCKRALVLSFYIMDGQNGNGERFLKLLLSNGYGLKFRYIFVQDETLEVELTKEELAKEMYDVKLNPSRAINDIIAVWNIFGGDLMGRDVGYGISFETVFCDKSNLIFRYMVNSSEMVVLLRENYTEEIKKEFLSGMVEDKGEARWLIDLCAVGHVDVVFRWIDLEKIDSCDWKITHQELSGIGVYPVI